VQKILTAWAWTSTAATLLALTLALAAPKTSAPPLPDMSGDRTCVSLYEFGPDGTLVFVGASESPSFKGRTEDLPSLIDVHLRHSFQFIGRTHGKSERWLAQRDAAPITLTDGLNYSPEYVRTVGGGEGGAVCWCATPTRGADDKTIIGCDFPCGSCEKCVVTG